MENTQTQTHTAVQFGSALMKCDTTAGKHTLRARAQTDRRRVNTPHTHTAVLPH